MCFRDYYMCVYIFCELILHLQYLMNNYNIIFLKGQCVAI